MNVVVHLPRLHNGGQQQIAMDPTRFRVVACGRRWGKTRLAVILGLCEMLRGGSVLWIAPSYDKAAVGWRLLETLCRQLPFVTIRRGERRIETANGWINVRSADSEGGLRGEGLSLIVVDECAHIRGFDRVWEQELRPTLTDRRGRGIFMSTPCGHNQFYELFRKNGDPEWRSWQFPTETNPYIHPDEIESARRLLPALVFRQEYLAEFVQLGGALFRREWLTVVDGLPPVIRRARCWDLAVTPHAGGNYTVGALLALAADGTLYVVDMIRGRWEWPDVLRLIATTAHQDGPDTVVGIESVGVQAGMSQALLRDPTLANVPIRPVPVSRDKISRALPLVARAEQGKLCLLRGSWNAALIDELVAFPHGEYDDQVDALSEALTLLTGTTAFVELIT